MDAVFHYGGGEWIGLPGYGCHRIRYKILLSWSFCPRSWSSQLAGSTVSKHQSLGGPDLQAFRSRWPDLSGFWIADMERVRPTRRRCNGAVTANLPASTEDMHLSRNHILILWSDISVDTFTGPCSDASYLGHFKNHWTELNWIRTPSTTVAFHCSNPQSKNQLDLFRRLVKCIKVTDIQTHTHTRTHTHE